MSKVVLKLGLLESKNLNLRLILFTSVGANAQI